MIDQAKRSGRFIGRPHNTLAQDLQDVTLALQRSEQQRAAAESALAEARHALRAAHEALVLSHWRESQARMAASRDTLTGLPNRAGFQQRSALVLARHVSKAQGFCVLFIDLDGFKLINDRLGHAAGDALLRIVGTRLQHAVRGADRVSRHGGDEFVCLLPQVQREDTAMAIGQKLIDAVSAPCQLGDKMVQVQASIGIALFPRHGHTVAALVDRADHAMLLAKSQNRGIGLAHLA